MFALIEVVWRYDPAQLLRRREPADAAAAREGLDRGNASFAALGAAAGRFVVEVGPEAFGLPRDEAAGLVQQPFAAVLGCSDARVPPELVFAQPSNALFVVRVAGNVPGTECVGSLNYAISHFDSLRLVAVVGHTGCGAVTAAVDALLEPQSYLEVAGDPQLRAIVDSLLAGVRMAAMALTETHGHGASERVGYREALIETAIATNAALTATVLQRTVGRPVAFGVFNLSSRTVGTHPAAGVWQPGLADAPAGERELAAVAAGAAASCQV